MTDKRKEKIPFYPFVLFLISVALLVVAGGYYINFPSQLNVFYFIIGISFIIAAIAFTCRPTLFKELFLNKKTVLWINDIVFILIVIAIGVLLSHIGFRRNYRYDITRNKIFSLSDLTIKTIRELPKDVKIYGFYPKGSNEEGIILDLFKEYKRHNDKLTWVMVDPQRDPITTKRMNISEMGTVVVECESNKISISPKDLFFIPNMLSASQGNNTPKFTGEQAITSAIANVITNEKRVVSIISGHDEPSITKFRSSDLAALNHLLIGENFEVVENSLLTGEIDSRAKVVLVVSPQKDYLESEIVKLKQYIENKKGNIIFAFDPNPYLKNLTDFVFKEFAVTPNYDIVVDPQGVSMNYWTVAPVMANHEITNPVKSKSLIGILFHSCSLTKENRQDVQHTVLMKSIDNSWAKRGLESRKQIGVHFDKSVDAQGPFDLAIIAQKTNTASGSKALILGDADILGNTYIAYSGNRDIILNAINWLAGNQKMISIRPRILETPRIQFNETDSSKIFTLCVFGWPLFIIFLGGIVYFYRRRV